MNLAAKFQRELVEAQARCNALVEFPDIEEEKDRWGQTRLVSEKVNGMATVFEIKNECDCCKGAAVYLIPYTEYQSIRIYSKPHCIKFARNYDGKILSIDDWQGEIEWDYFPPEFMDKVEEWLETHEADIDSVEGW
jgi:hypothetical protein